MLIQIANLKIKLNCPTNLTLTTLLKEYIIEKGTADAAIDVKINNNIPLPDEEVYGPYKNLYYSFDSEGRINIYSIPEGFGECIFKVVIQSDYKEVSIDIADFTDVIVGFDLGRFMITAIGVVYSRLILKNGGFVIHGSSISYKGNGIVFSAKSGTGKSTQTRLWMESLTDVVLINDDSPAITFDEDTVYLNGTPFAGTTGINTNKTVPLRALVFIERSKEPYIEKLSFKEAIPRFMDEIGKSLVSDNISLCVDFAAKLMEKVPVYLLHCNMEKESVDTLKNQLQL